MEDVWKLSTLGGKSSIPFVAIYGINQPDIQSHNNSLTVTKYRTLTNNVKSSFS